MNTIERARLKDGKLVRYNGKLYRYRHYRYRAHTMVNVEDPRDYEHLSHEEILKAEMEEK